MSSFNRIQRQYNWVCKNIKGPLYRIKMRELYIEAKKAILDPHLTPEQKTNTNRYPRYHKIKTMKKLIIVMAILLTSCVEKRVESTNWVDIGGKPDVTIHKVGNHQVLTFTFEQDGHKYMVGIYNQGGIDMVEIHE